MRPVFAILVAALFAGCLDSASDPHEAALSSPQDPQVAFIERAVPGYGTCTFAYVYAGKGVQGGPALALVGCR
jgi:hypothetical protein